MAAPATDTSLATEPIGKLIFKLSLPSVAAQLINVLYNIVDRIYIGNIPEIGATALTGVGLAFPILMIISAFSAFAGMGGAPLASIQMGAGNYKKAEKILGNCVSLLVCLAVVLTVGFSIFKRPLLNMFGASSNTIGYAMDYVQIYLFGTIFVQISIGLNTFISAQGRAKTAMFSVLIGAVLNIVLDPIFIFVFNMGVKGAALATILSQAVSCIWVLSFLLGKKTSIRIRRENLKLDKAIVGKVTALGSAPFVMQSTESLVSITLNSGLQRYGGDLFVGSMTIMQSVMMMIMMPMAGIQQGVQPIMSYNYGARNNLRVRKAFFATIKITMTVSCVGTLFVCLFAGVLARIFTPNVELIALVKQYMPIYFAGIWAMGAMNACQCTFMALGQAKTSLFLASLRKIVLLIPLAIVLPMITGNVLGIYIAEPIADIIAASTTLILFLTRYKKLLPLDEETLPTKR